MKTLGKTIIVRRGETFVLSRKVFKADGSPFVLSNSIVNPYLIITVSSNTYHINGGYKMNYWLDLSKYPKFDSVTPVVITSTELSENKLPDGYTADEQLDCWQAIFYVVSSTQRDYYYYTNGQYKSYSFVFTKQFLNYHTSQWIESVYQYEFRLVGGQKMEDFLLPLYKAIYPGRDWIPTDNRTLYNEIKKCRPDLVQNIRYSAPLASYFVEDILQRPEKLVIKANC